MKSELHCPICAGHLVPKGDSFSVEELFKLWHPIHFSADLIASHKTQAVATQMYTCKSCHLGLFHPQIIGSAEFYEQLQGDAEHPYYSNTKWDFSEALKDIADVESLIELGCGPGEFLQLSENAGTRVIGTEYNQKALAIARGKGLKVMGTEGPSPDLLASFDAAFSFHVLEHVSDPMQFLRELVKWVRPGGKIGISVPNQNGIVQFIKPCVSDMPPHHATRWSLKTFKAVAQVLGLHIERVAFEPLFVKDAYYLDYWAKTQMENSVLNPLFQRTARFLIPKVVNRMKKHGMTTIPGFRGLAIYVLFSKPTA